jgi:hypothetical protein
MSDLTFTDILRSEVARMQALQPERLGEFARAHAAIVEGHVVDTHDGNGKVLSRNGHTWYTTNGVCTCAAADHGKACRHLQAWKLYQHVAKKHAEATQVPAQDETTPLRIPAHFLTTVQGTRCIKYAGLLSLAHAAGLQSLAATYTANEPELSVAHAVALFADGRRFEESGDATPSNAARVKEHWRRMSLTRAKARVLRDALAIDVVSVEEME